MNKVKLINFNYDIIRNRNSFEKTQNYLMISNIFIQYGKNFRLKSLRIYRYPQRISNKLYIKSLENPKKIEKWIRRNKESNKELFLDILSKEFDFYKFDDMILDKDGALSYLSPEEIAKEEEWEETLNEHLLNPPTREDLENYLKGEK